MPFGIAAGRALCLPVMFLLAAAGAAAGQDPQATVPLEIRRGLLEPAAAGSADYQPPRTVKASELVRVNLDAGLEDASGPARLVELHLPGPAGRVLAELRMLEHTVSGREIWQGTLQGVELSSVVWIVDREARTITGHMSLPGSSYQIRPLAGNLHALEQIDPAAFPDEHVIEPEIPEADPAAEPDRDPLLRDDGSRIDVMVVYTPAARMGAGGDSAVRTLIELAIAQTNQSYQNSGITPRLRLVYMGEMVNYVESADFLTNLQRLQRTNDGFMDEVHALRDAYGADMVALIVEGMQYCGMGYLGNPSSGFAPWAFQATARQCATAHLAFAHEFGHVQGARHDRFVETGSSSWATYNYGYVSPANNWRTIMAYANRCGWCPSVNYWSNPDTLYNGMPMGVAEGQPDAADNRKTLNTTAIHAANWRAEVQPPAAVTLVSPSGVYQGGWGQAFTWHNLTGAASYLLYINEPGQPAIHEQWYPATACQNVTVGGVASCRIAPNVTLQPNRTYQWWVRAWNGAGNGPWGTPLSFTLQPPPPATLISPSGSTTNQNPTYTWNRVNAASDYLLWVQPTDGEPAIQQWYASTVCGATTCSTTPSTTLPAGRTYRWWIQTRSDTGHGAWSTPLSFTIPVPPPPTAATLASPSGTIGTTTPPYTWNRVNSATWYYLWVQASGQAPILQTWYRSAEICGSTTCSINPGRALSNGTSYTWWIQTWNDGGHGPWSAGMPFTVSLPPPPPAATLVSPTGTVTSSTPTYTWNRVTGSSWYYVWINAGSTNIFRQWFTAASVCGTTTCSVTPSLALAHGPHTWWIQTYGDGSGNGPWSAGMSFTVQPSGTSVPAAATLIAPIGGATTSATPTFQWSRVTNSTWYYLWVQPAGGSPVVQAWYTSASACPSGASHCSVTLPAPGIGPGSYQWWILTYNELGNGPWSAAGTFSRAP